MIFTVVLRETVTRIVEVEVEAPTIEVAKERAIEQFNLGTILDETSSIDTNDMIVRTDDSD